jgi:hypothetical protein
MGTKEALEMLNSIKVGFKVYTTWIEFGYPDALGSWFDTICIRLEDGKWGSRFPIVMNKLYIDDGYGVLYEDIEEFKKELETIHIELSQLPLSDAIWDTKTPDVSAPLDHPNLDWNASDLGGFYKNQHKNLYDVILRAIESMEFRKANCFIQAENQSLDKSKIIIDGKKLIEDENA